MDCNLPLQIIPKIIAAIPAGEVLVRLSIEDRGSVSIPYLGWTQKWRPGIVEIEVRTYAIVDGQHGIKTWTAFRAGSDGYGLRLDSFRAELPPMITAIDGTAPEPL